MDSRRSSSIVRSIISGEKLYLVEIAIPLQMILLEQFIVARSEGGSAQSLRASTQLIAISNLDS